MLYYHNLFLLEIVICDILAALIGYRRFSPACIKYIGFFHRYLIPLRKLFGNILHLLLSDGFILTYRATKSNYFFYKFSFFYTVYICSFSCFPYFFFHLTFLFALLVYILLSNPFSEINSAWQQRSIRSIRQGYGLEINYWCTRTSHLMLLVNSILYFFL